MPEIFVDLGLKRNTINYHPQIGTEKGLERGWEPRGPAAGLQRRPPPARTGSIMGAMKNGNYLCN